MNLKQKAFSVVGIAALTLGMTTGIGLAQTTGTGTGEFNTGDLPCDGAIPANSDLSLTVNAGDIDFGALPVAGNGVVSDNTDPVDLVVDAGCAAIQAWTVTVDADNFTGTSSWLPVPHSVSSNLLELTSNADVDYSPDADFVTSANWAWNFFECSTPQPVWGTALIPVQAGTTFLGAVGQSEILDASTPVSCPEAGFGGNVGAPGTTLATWNAELDLTGIYLLPNATYTSALTFEVNPAP